MVSEHSIESDEHHLRGPKGNTDGRSRTWAITYDGLCRMIDQISGR